MNVKKIAVRAGLILIGLPALVGAALLVFFYSVFYFPNWSDATAQTLVSSGEKRRVPASRPKELRPCEAVAARHFSSHVDVVGQLGNGHQPMEQSGRRERIHRGLSRRERIRSQVMGNGSKARRRRTCPM